MIVKAVHVPLSFLFKGEPLIRELLREYVPGFQLQDSCSYDCHSRVGPYARDSPGF